MPSRPTNGGSTVKGTRHYRRYFAATIAALGATAGFAASANAITLTNFDTGNVESQPLGIVALPSGSLQFADAGVNALGTISPAGIVNLNTYTGAQGPAQIALDSAGSTWVTEGGALTGTSVTRFVGGVPTRVPVGVPALNLQGIASVGGSLWFVSQDSDALYSVTNSGTVGGPFSTAQGGSPGPPVVPPTAGTSPKGITKGPGADTNVYIATATGVSVASTTGGAGVRTRSPGSRTHGPSPSAPTATSGSATPAASPTSTRRAAASGAASPIGGSNVNAITTGADGALWFTESALDKVGRVTTAGALTEFALPGCDVPSGIAKGTDNLLYVTCFGAEITPGGPTTGHTIVRIAPDGVTPGPGPGPGPGPVTPPVTNLKGGFSFAKGKVFAGKAFTVKVTFNKAVTKSRVRVQIKSVNTRPRARSRPSRPSRPSS